MSTAAPPIAIVHDTTFSRLERVLAPLLIALGLYLLVGPALSSDFSPYDDHEIIDYLISPSTLGAQIMSDFADWGRFRPLYYALRQAEIRILGTNLLAWHLLVFGVGVLTLWLIYRTMRRLVPSLYAVLALLIPLLYPDSTAIWYRLGPQETVGMLLIVAALAAMLARRDAFFVGFALLAAYYKESFAFLAPALILLRLALVQDRQSEKRWVIPALVTLALLSAVPVALAALLKFGQVGIAGPALVGGVGTRVGVNLLALVLPVAGLLPLIFALGLYPRRALLIVVILFLWLVPQAALYADVLNERYYWPAILAPAVAMPLALYALRNRRLLLGVALAVFALFAVIALPYAARQRDGAIRYAQLNNRFQETLHEIVTERPAVAHLDYPEPWQIEERAASRAFLQWYGYTGPVTFGDDCEGLYC